MKGRNIMKLYRTLPMVLALVATPLFPSAAGAVSPSGDQAKGGAPQGDGFTDLQDITGCDFTLAGQGMQLLSCPNQDGAFPQAGLEVGDVIFSINRMRTTDIDSLINAANDAETTPGENPAEVVVIDHRTGNVVVISIQFSDGSATQMAPATSALSPQLLGTCGGVFNPVVRGGILRRVRAKAHWTLACHGGQITMSGWVEDTLADGKCAQVKAVFSNGNVFYSSKACPKGTRKSFSWSGPGRVADGYLLVN
jgi:hypothetical protein